MKTEEDDSTATDKGYFVRVGTEERVAFAHRAQARTTRRVIAQDNPSGCRGVVRLGLSTRWCKVRGPLEPVMGTEENMCLHNGVPFT